MTKEELKKWIAEATYFDSKQEFDENGNCEEWRIYEKNGELFRIEFQNDNPYEKWGEKGYIRGVYELKKVIKKTEIVERVIYQEIV